MRAALSALALLAALLLAVPAAARDGVRQPAADVEPLDQDPARADDDFEPLDGPPRVDVDCVDLRFQEVAQSVLARNPGDPFNLDPSGDGFACSSLPPLADHGTNLIVISTSGATDPARESAPETDAEPTRERGQEGQGG